MSLDVQVVQSCMAQVESGIVQGDVGGTAVLHGVYGEHSSAIDVDVEFHRVETILLYGQAGVLEEMYPFDWLCGVYLDYGAARHRVILQY